MQINIPKPHAQPSSEPSDLTILELAEMSASKRNIIIYERTIDELRSQVKDLIKHNTILQSNLLSAVQENAKIPQLLRGKTEMYVSTVVSSILMAFGGGLISSFPITPDNKIPWQFSAGWTLLGLAVLLGILIRPIVWVVYYRFVCKKEQVPPAAVSID